MLRIDDLGAFFRRPIPAKLGGTDQMSEIIDINTGEIEVRKGPCILRAMALGSCIAVAAYDSRVGIAGMAHIMLPGGVLREGDNDTRYAVFGIAAMLNRMCQVGSNMEDIEVCLVGAGNVLRNEEDTICSDNIRSVTTVLQEKNIPIRATVLGGYERKIAYLDAGTGRISFTVGSGARQSLWSPDADRVCDSGW